MLARFRVRLGLPLFEVILVCVIAIWGGFEFTVIQAAEPPGSVYVLNVFEDARGRFANAPTNTRAAWQFARACFDLAEFSTNDAQRVSLADQGIAAARKALASESNSAPARYYLAMDLGQLARTKYLGALPLVVQMEREFNLARIFDENLDYAGPDRCLGLLYRDAPSLASIGDKSKARSHLLRSLELAPTYPDNRLNWIESCLRWGDRAEAHKQLKLLEAQWGEAQTKLRGPEWEGAWADWKTRLAQVRRTLTPPP